MNELIVQDEQSLNELIKRVRAAQAKFATYTQEQVDKIFLAAATAADKARLDLAEMAVSETGMGIVEDKVIKNHYAAEYIYNAYRDVKTCDVVETDDSFGVEVLAEPVGVVAAIVPTTNPTSTAIFKALLALKTRNGLIFSPHPRAKNCTIAAARTVLDAAVKAGAPEGIIGWIDVPSVALSAAVMSGSDLILATGGPGMVRAAYSSGKPAVGVGAGNTPVIIDSSADIKLAASSVLHSKSFDNGMICASEQSVIVMSDVYDAFKKEIAYRGAYFLNAEEIDKVRGTILINGSVNAKIVGQSAPAIARLCGFEAPESARILVGEVESVEISEPFAHEKLSPVLAMYKAESFDDALKKAEKLVADGGFGHTSVIYANEHTAKDKIAAFGDLMKTCRILVNTPAAQGGIGDIYNFKLRPSLTLGCGSWGGNSVSENVSVKHLLNYKTVAKRRENMLWFRAPEKVYFKKGCMPVALQELKDMGKKRVFIVTDEFLFKSGFSKRVSDRLNEMGIVNTTFSDVQPDPTLASAKKGAAAMRSFEPDTIVALGGGSALDAGKIMWMLYEHPEVDFADMAMRFMDIRKRVYRFPEMGKKAYFVAIATTAGTGSEVTPFAVITDETSGLKYPIADYELLPKMAICDPELMMSIPKGLTANSGYDAMVHALEAVASVMSSDFANGMAKEAIKLIFEYLPVAYKNGSDETARAEMAYAATMAGMAFANAFLGVCHSMAHKLGSYHHLPHGMANALLLNEVMRFNAAEAPAKMGTFPQYDHPVCLRRYAEVAELVGIKGKTDEEKFEKLLDKLADLRKEVGLPESIKAAGVPEDKFLEQLDKMSRDAFDDQCTGANPRYPMIAEIKQMYLNAYYGKEGK
ncbi:bifunctional acetaldehyde-CoA/alcohol dehydrogenase [Anaerocaecibacter muris]|uniref:bifunctional acetaldehyde-CoA/alcohol dehydrogenase n=1 Tax=Anaerocaecibacter muris TaxID=2941513 RepID=UPI00203F648A|nr:bifunctional acetaldehyde-CoA/alcohol dehydrogenase [Anaerocaecibacter muris]